MTVKALNGPAGLNVMKVRAPSRMSGAASPIARERARIEPVAIPGTAAGRTWWLIVCHRVAPSASEPSRMELGTARIASLDLAAVPSIDEAVVPAVPVCVLLEVDGRPEPDRDAHQSRQPDDPERSPDGRLGPGLGRKTRGIVDQGRQSQPWRSLDHHLQEQDPEGDEPHRDAEVQQQAEEKLAPRIPAHVTRERRSLLGSARAHPWTAASIGREVSEGSLGHELPSCHRETCDPTRRRCRVESQRSPLRYIVSSLPP